MTHSEAEFQSNCVRVRLPLDIVPASSSRHREQLRRSSSLCWELSFWSYWLFMWVGVCQQCFYFTKMHYGDDRWSEKRTSNAMKNNIPLRDFRVHYYQHFKIHCRRDYRIIPVTVFVNMHAHSCQKPAQTWRESCALLSKLPTRNPLLRIFHPFRLAMICDPSFLVRSIFSKF